MEEIWELLEEGRLCNEGRKLCGRRIKVKCSGKSLKNKVTWEM